MAEEALELESEAAGVKLLIETGGGGHTTSSASCQAKFHGGPHAGQFLYQMKQYQTGQARWDTSKRNEKWVETVYMLPEGTQIEVTGQGRTGDRGSTRHAFHRIYRLESAAPVLDTVVSVGLRDCTLKGRLVLVEDVLASRAEASRANMEEGF